MTLYEAIKTRLNSIIKVRELRRRSSFHSFNVSNSKNWNTYCSSWNEYGIIEQFTNNSLAQFLDLFSGGAIKRASIFSF